MEPTLSPYDPAWREWRRLRAWQLFQQGWKQKDIAIALDATQGAVSQWITRAKTQGAAALKRRKAPGATPKLTPEQKAQIPALLLRGAEAFGFVGDVWTCERIATVIEHEFGVVYHPEYVGCLLRALGWSYQKPVCRATQQKEEAVRQWQHERLPDLKKGRKRAGINSCS
jgi:transposase